MTQARRMSPPTPMLTILSQRPDEIQQFCAGPWPFQKTFPTPLKELNRFVTTCLAAFPQLEVGILSTDQVGFEPKHVLDLMSAKALKVENSCNITLGADGTSKIGS